MGSMMRGLRRENDICYNGGEFVKKVNIGNYLVMNSYNFVRMERL